MSFLKPLPGSIFYLSFILLSIRCGGETLAHGIDESTGRSPVEGAQPSVSNEKLTLKEEANIKLLRDSCQRCHDNARVKRVERGETIEPIIRSANFNMQSLTDNDFKKTQVRQKILRAIQKNMPVSVFVFDKKEFTKEKFLESPQGKDLIDWLKSDQASETKKN